MRRVLMSLLAASALLSARPALAVAARAQGKGAPPAKSKRTRTDNHPKIREAIASLEAAKAELEQASGDFGGHKAEAIEAVNNALKRLRLALQFDRY
jgi:hypothetical protein